VSLDAGEHAADFLGFAEVGDGVVVLQPQERSELLAGEGVGLVGTEDQRLLPRSMLASISLTRCSSRSFSSYRVSASTSPSAHKRGR
jgi:hypothetical protein